MDEFKRFIIWQLSIRVIQCEVYTVKLKQFNGMWTFAQTLWLYKCTWISVELKIASCQQAYRWHGLLNIELCLWCLRRILGLRWYHLVSNCEVRRLTEQPPLTSIIQKRRLTLFGHLVRMDESADARRILTAVPQSEWRRPVGRPYTSWMAILKNDLAQHNLTLEDAIELALNKPLWKLLAASGATHWWCMPNNDDDDDDDVVWVCLLRLCTDIYGLY